MDVTPAELSTWRRARRGVVGVRWRVVSLFASPLYSLYTRRLRERVIAQPLPRHVAVILDGNRRWASLAGLREPGAGHRHGADKLDELLSTRAPVMTKTHRVDRLEPAPGRAARRVRNLPVGGRPRTEGGPPQRASLDRAVLLAQQRVATTLPVPEWPGLAS